MKKLYKVKFGTDLGIDFNSVLCFYLEFENVSGYSKKVLKIIVGSKFGEPSEISIDYSFYNMPMITPENFIDGDSDWKILKESNRLYNDLIEFFSK